MAVCEKCGAQVLPVDQFCPCCGIPLNPKPLRETDIPRVTLLSRNMEWHGRELLERIRTVILSAAVVFAVAAAGCGVYLYYVSPSRQIRIAQQYSMQRKYDDAERVLLNVISRDEDNVDAYLGLAQNYDSSQDYVKASWVYNKLLELDNENRVSYYQRLSQLYELQGLRGEQYQVLLQLQNETGDPQVQKELESFKNKVYCSLPEGEYPAGTQVVLSIEDSNSSIYYNLEINGVEDSFKLYSEPLKLPAGTVVLKVYAENKANQADGIQEYHYQVSETEAEYSLPTLPDVSQYLYNILLFDVPSPFNSVAEIDQSQFGGAIIKASMDSNCSHFTADEIAKLQLQYDEFSGSETFVCYRHANETAQKFFGGNFTLKRQNYDFFEYHDVQGGIFTTVPMGEGGRILSLIYNGGKTGNTYVVDVAHYVNDFGYEVRSPSDELLGQIDNNIEKSALQQAVQHIVMEHLENLPRRRYTIVEQNGRLTLTRCEVISS